MPAEPDIVPAAGLPAASTPTASPLAGSQPTRATASGEGRLPLSILVSYGLPSTALAATGSLVGLYLLIYVTDTLMVPAAVFGAAFAASRIWDGVSDPVVGFLSDRTRSRMGRRRPWIGFGAIPLAVVYLGLWAPPTAIEGTALAIWIAVAIVLYYTTYTVVNIPHMAWGAELTLDYQERNRVFGSRALFDVAGILMAAGAIWLLERAEDERAVGTVVALAAGALAISLCWYCVARLKERPEFQGRGPMRPDAAILDVLRNRYARLLIAVFFLDSLGFGCLMVLFPYMAKYTMPEGTSAGLFLGATMGVAALSFVAWFRLSRRFGKRNPWLAANAIKVFVFALLYFMDPSDIILVWVAVVLMGAVQPAGMILAPSIKADVVDVDEYQTGERKEGTYFAMWNLAYKLASGLAILIASSGLQLAGFEPNVEQPPEMIGTLKLLFAGLPLALHVVGIVVLLRFDLDEPEHARIRAELDARAESARTA